MTPGVMDFRVSALAAGDAANTAERRRRADNTDACICAADLAGKMPEPRPWLVRDWIPRRQVTLFSGHGGNGKSLLALQLAVAVASGTPWLGLETEQGAVFALWCEDEPNEVHRRLIDVSSAANVSIDELTAFSFQCPVTGNVALFDANGATEAWRRLQERLEVQRPRLVILDASADLFDDNEVDRARVRQFIRQLRGLAVELDAAVLLLSHPSRQGQQSGDGLSGSTAWHNSARARIVLEKPGEDDPDRRELKRVKSNYSAASADLVLRYQDGAFVAEASIGSLDKLARGAQADRVFLSMARKLIDQGFDLYPAPGRGFAPNLIAERPEAEGLSSKELALAMARCIDAGRLRIIEVGPPSKTRKKLALPEAAS